jgi:outer membrane protein
MRAFFILIVAQMAQAETRRLTVEDALAEVQKSHPQLTAARARVKAGRDNALIIGAHLLPSIRLNEEFQHYNAPFDIQFGGGSFRARDQDTNTFSAAVDQPLLGLGKITEEFLARRSDTEASRQSLRALEDDLTAQLRVAFLRHFQARAAVEVAQASAHQLDEQVTITEAKVRAGVLTTADLLRVRVAADNARQQGIVAQAQAEVMRVQIVTAVGLRPDEPVELAEPSALIGGPTPAPGSFDEALHARPEVAAARALVSSADHRRRYGIWAMLPDIDAEGAYLRIDGQVFAPKNSAFVGVRASWAIWEWGSSFFAARAAAHAAEAARAELEGRRRQVEVEVASRNAELGAAASAVRLAESTITSAEEAYRVTEAQVRAGAATTTDLLDAQAALTQARLNRSRARYEEAIARVNLLRARGR